MSIINIEELHIKDWQIQDLKNINNFNFIKSLVDDFCMTLNPGDSFLLFKVLTEVLNKFNSQLKREDLELFNKYQKEFKKLKILSLIDCDLDYIKEILTNDLLFIFQYNIPILTLLMSYTRWRKENFFINLASYIEFLRLNEEKLGFDNGEYPFNEENVKPRIRDWINSYIIFTSGRPSKMNGLSITEFISNNQDVKKLNKNNRFILERILKLFNIFASPDNYRIYYQQPYLFDRLEPTDELISPIINEQIDIEIKKSDREFVEYYNEIINEYFKNETLDKKLENLKNYNSQDILDKLTKAVMEKDINLVLAILETLIKNKEFQLIEKTTIFNNWLADLYKKYSNLNNLNLVNKEQRIILYGQFIKMLFIEKLSLKNDDSVALMIHLANLLNENKIGNYLSLAYANLSDNKFYWREVDVENGKLVLK